MLILAECVEIFNCTYSLYENVSPFFHKYLIYLNILKPLSATKKKKNDNRLLYQNCSQALRSQITFDISCDLSAGRQFT